MAAWVAALAYSRAYLQSAKNLPAILTAIQEGQAPERFTIRFLEQLGYKSTSDRAVIGVLKALGFLTEAGIPTSRYHEFLDRDQGKKVLREAIEEAYPALFKIRRDAHRMSRQEVKNKLKTITEGKFKESVLDKMAGTFLALANEADWTSHTQRPQSESNGGESVAVEVRPPEQVQSHEVASATPLVTRPPRIERMTYVIELRLPATRDPAVYDALFRSLKEHLL